MAGRSAFCARHILRNFGRLGDLPLFWTREQRGEEACAWLLFAHKLAYLQATRRYMGSASMVRVFCVPERAVRDSPTFERILLFLAVALMEAYGVQVQVCTEPEYSDVEGFVLVPPRCAIVATWCAPRACGTSTPPLGARFSPSSPRRQGMPPRTR
ncbi:MAG: hypothetical protein ACR2H2_06355 [Solirubrobacteraceae bacterium]